MSIENTALVVASDRRDRERLASWLEQAGYEAMVCPGPAGREACLGLRGPRCPLAGAADVVVVDLGSEHDPLDDHVAGWELLQAYLGQGLPVAALTLPGDTLFLEESAGRLVELERTVSRRRLLEAVRDLAAA